MLRRVLLVAMATVVSYALTACSGYILYTLAEGRSEANLSLMVRFIFNPAIAMLVGMLVGFLSKDHPALTVSCWEAASPAVFQNGPSYCTLLATLENTLFAFPPIKRIVPMIMIRITASMTAYSATPDLPR